MKKQYVATLVVMTLVMTAFATVATALDDTPAAGSCGWDECNPAYEYNVEDPGADEELVKQFLKIHTG